MPAINIERSIRVKKSANEVYNMLIDFNEWLHWSPWLVMENDAEVNISEDARYYEWKGNRIGEGNMTIISEDPNKKIEYDLNFLKPWKSQSQVSFTLTEDKDYTNVSWEMESSLPFFMFWMKKSMEAYVGMDYERGLRMLKDYLENGSIKSSIKSLGKSHLNGFNYIGISRNCAMDKLSTSMAADFRNLGELKNKYPEISFDKTFSMYEKWDVKNKSVKYLACKSVNKTPIDLDQNYTFGNIPSTNIYTLRHTGSYKHLGNAWATMMNLKQMKEISVNNKISPFEDYVSDPTKVEEEHLITDVVFALK